MSDNANKQAGGQSSEPGVAREEERRRSLVLHSDLPTPYLVVSNLPADVSAEELFEAFR